MLLEEKIQEYWRDTPELCSAVAVDRFFTGPVPRPLVPCVVLMHEKSDVLFHTNRSAPWHKTVLRFELYHDSLEAGLKIARIIEQKFDRLRLQDPQGNWSARFHAIEAENLRTNDGVWKFVQKISVSG